MFHSASCQPPNVVAIKRTFILIPTAMKTIFHDPKLNALQDAFLKNIFLIIADTNHHCVGLASFWRGFSSSAHGWWNFEILQKRVTSVLASDPEAYSKEPGKRRRFSAK